MTVHSSDAASYDKPTAGTPVRVSNAGILTWDDELLVLDDEPPEVGRAVAVTSGGRLAFRRVLEVMGGGVLRLRADIAPFDDLWDGEVVGCVRPRWIDRLAAVDPERWTRAGWLGAMTLARGMSMRRRVRPKRRGVDLITRELATEEWSRVRSFWRVACGKELHVAAHPNQHVVGLFDGGELVGANIHLVFGAISYSAFTLVDRRYRGTGGGQKMIRHSVQQARDEGLESIYVHINVRNLPSILAYLRAGFTETGWWTDASDPLASAERQWKVFEIDLAAARPASLG